MSRRGVNDSAKLTRWAPDITLISPSRVTKKFNKGKFWVKTSCGDINHSSIPSKKSNIEFYYLLLVKYNVPVCGGFLVE